MQWLNFGDAGGSSSSSSGGGGGTAPEDGEEESTTAGLAVHAAPTAYGKAARDAAPSRPLLANAAWTSARRRARWLSGSVDSYSYGGGKDRESTFVRFRIRCCIAQSDSDIGGMSGVRARTQNTTVTFPAYNPSHDLTRSPGTGAVRMFDLLQVRPGLDVWEVDRRFSEFDKVHACVAQSCFVLVMRPAPCLVLLAALRASARSFCARVMRIPPSHHGTMNLYIKFYRDTFALYGPNYFQYLYCSSHALTPGLFCAFSLYDCPCALFEPSLYSSPRILGYVPQIFKREARGAAPSPHAVKEPFPAARSLSAPFAQDAPEAPARARPVY